MTRLKQLRQLRGVTQEEFAERSGISYKYYQAVEAGRKPDLRLSTSERLAKGFGIDVHELLAPEMPEVRRIKKRGGISRM